MAVTLPIQVLAEHVEPPGNTASCERNTDTHFITHPVFDLTSEDTIFLHHWANFFHINTKEVTLVNEAAFFLKKCQVVAADLEELERYLRKRKYIRDATVVKSENDKVVVNVWDNWSLMPTLDFGRKGGKNKYAFGIKDNNLLGLGIDAQLEYFVNDQRKGYKLDSKLPLFLQQNISATLRLIDGDDGNSSALYLEKPFVSFDTSYAFNVGASRVQQHDTVFQNGAKLAVFAHNKLHQIAQYGWLYRDNGNYTLRFNAGVNKDLAKFKPLIFDQVANEAQYLPENRDLSQVFFGLEFLAKDYQKLQNIYLIGHTEDFNLGWEFDASLGTGYGNQGKAPEMLWQFSARKAWLFNRETLLQLQFSFDGEHYAADHDRLFGHFSAELFHKFSDNWGWYFKHANTFSKHQYLDQPVALGGESGVRGYPLQYQHGERRAVFNSELRYYPKIHIYNLFELGAVAFWDAGKAFGANEQQNIESGWLQSVGLGARFYSTHSSDQQVIHLDIAFPRSANKKLDSVEFRISTNHVF